LEWITTSDVVTEAWRRILEFANTDLALEAITQRHGAAATKSAQQNYKKQAQQIRVTILQAREYFVAAEGSTLFTSPNHLYYGIVSLASAIMLLRGNGEKALDRLRQSEANRHHGLDFTTAATANTSKTELNILAESYVKVRETGHFMNWYCTLPGNDEVFALVRRSVGGRTGWTGIEPVGEEDMLSPREIAGRKRPLLDMLQFFPDLHRDLRRYGVIIASSRMNYEVTRQGENGFEQHQWNIHGASDQDCLEEILGSFKTPSVYTECFQWEVDPTCTAAIVIFRSLNPNAICQFPSIRVDPNNNQFLYAQDLQTPEIVDAYMVVYGLSMLSRYYPDLWISCLESHCKSAQLIERVVWVMIHKVPVIALRILSDRDIIISTQRAPWYTP
jgi:hypothetical protein